MSVAPVIGRAFAKFDPSVEVHGHSMVGGGCINNASLVKTSKGPFFIKWNMDAPEQMFEKEARGLELIASTNSMRTPKPYCHGDDFLILEYVDSGSRAIGYWEEFGKGLAELHSVQAGEHGFDHSNYIGRLAQYNEAESSWVDFFAKQRLAPQLEMARRSGYLNAHIEHRFGQLICKLPELMPDLPPSLLHGDLWSGNFMTGPDGKAWLIDPAVYYGNREIEMAFTYLFGGFDPRFYESYNHHLVLATGFKDRVPLYNLYPLLVHLNLFGKGYLGQIIRTLGLFF